MLLLSDRANTRCSVCRFDAGLERVRYVVIWPCGKGIFAPAVEFRFSDGQDDRRPALAADLLVGKWSCLSPDRPSALAARAATATIPVVFAYGGDPLESGLVASLTPASTDQAAVNMQAAAQPQRLLGLEIPHR
jgi:hypothetical protein